MQERLGQASVPRPKGLLVWIHAASVGEANAVLPLIDRLTSSQSGIGVLLTTVTVTSAALVEKRLPEHALHQFAPVDTPDAVTSFLKHWRPDMALWVDSEFWPNMMMLCRERGIPMGLLNARISQRSYRRWKRVGGFMRTLLGCFDFCFAQSAGDADRLKALGLACPAQVGNLKYDAPPLPHDDIELQRMRAQAQGRPIWVAASTHPGEESQVLEVHAQLRAAGLNPLTVIVPRHAVRGDEIAALPGQSVCARRSWHQPITPETQIYLADTMGELGLFYRLASIAFIGGSLVPHGGQNPLEAAQLGCVVVAGPHMDNFDSVAQLMAEEGALIRVSDKATLARELENLLGTSGDRAQRAAAAQEHVRAHGGVLAAILSKLNDYLQAGGLKAGRQ